MKTLIVMVGLPRSGKSTWAQKQHYPMVNLDSIRLALHGTAFIGTAEPMVWTLAHYFVRALFRAGHDHVILDATNTTKKRREQWKSKLWVRHFEVIRTPIETCLDRTMTIEDEKRREGLQEAIVRQDEFWEEIEPEEWEDQLHDDEDN